MDNKETQPGPLVTSADRLESLAWAALRDDDPLRAYWTAKKARLRRRLSTALDLVDALAAGD